MLDMYMYINKCTSCSKFDKSRALKSKVENKSPQSACLSHMKLEFCSASSHYSI